MHKRDKLLSIIAEDVDSILEEPRGSNWGRAVKSLLAYVKISFPAPWCAAYVCDRLDKAGLDNPVTGWTPGVLSWYSKRGRAGVKPAPGYLFFLYYPSLRRVGHVGFVESVKGDTVTTIEGNTNTDGSREGYAVCRRKRKLSTIHTFAQTYV